MIAHQRQPSATSCGPTCVAMIVGAPVREVLTWLPAVRITPRRTRVRTHRTNVGEFRRLLEACSWRLGRRRRDAIRSAGPAVVRIDHPTGRGWHWVVVAGAQLFDPARDGPRQRVAFLHRVDAARVSWYPVER